MEFVNDNENFPITEEIMNDIVSFVEHLISVDLSHYLAYSDRVRLSRIKNKIQDLEARINVREGKY